MNTNGRKSEAKKFLDAVRGGPLSFGRMIESIRRADEMTPTSATSRRDGDRYIRNGPRRLPRCWDIR